MAMNEVIRGKRKELGLTQEKMAEYLGVSAPAVNKWEKGTNCPDVSLLPALARLLKIDLNTLLCFNEELTEQEIAAFCQEAAEAVREGGMEGGFRLVREKVRDYPSCGALIYNAALVMDGAWFIKGTCSEEREKYADEIISLYERAAECGDGKVAAGARFMLASKYMNRGEFEMAQAMLDLMPERESFDKCQMQANLYFQQGKLAEAGQLLERSLIRRLMELQGVLIGLADIAMKEGRPEDAASIGERWRAVAEQMGLWEYNGLVISLQAAIDREDEAESIGILRGILSAVLKMWDRGESPLYRHIPPEGVNVNYAKQILPPPVHELESCPKYEFLQDNEEFRELMERYRAASV